MTDQTSSQPPTIGAPSTIAEVLETAEPMGDLRRFAIEDLTPDEEDLFFKILEDC